MKIHYILKEVFLFSYIFVYILLPPLRQNQALPETFSSWTFPFFQLILAVVSIFVLVIEFFPSYIKEKIKIKVTKTDFAQISSFLISFGLLFTGAAVFNTIALLFHIETDVKVTLPATAFMWACCLLQFLAGAVFEENVYRIYLPAVFFKLKRLLRIPENLLFVSLIELIPALIFAFSHRYLGYFSVANAFFAHFVLRFCLKKSDNFTVLYAVHFLYNFINLIFTAC